tara:strand:- start:631 stop:807 length:177 start_codon:yes stop_codon:yes gene_type:complete
MNKEQVKIIFNGILLVVGLLILVGTINTVVLETIDVLENVPHIMDTPPDDTLDISIDE